MRRGAKLRWGPNDGLVQGWLWTAVAVLLWSLVGIGLMESYELFKALSAGWRS